MNTCTENSCNLYSGYHNIHLFLHLPFSNGDCNDEQRMWGEIVTNMNPDDIISLPDLNAVPCTTPHNKNFLTYCIKLFLVNYIFLLHQGSYSASRDFVIRTNLRIDPILQWKLEHFPIRRYELAHYSYIFKHCNNIHVDLLREIKLYEIYFFFFTFPSNKLA